MSENWVADINNMHHKFGVDEWFEKNRDNKELMAKYIKFRLDMCKEELDETYDALDNKDPEEIVDGLIDLCVFAIGTLDVFRVDAWEAWNRVWMANMEKEPGVKSDRPNPFGLPDLIKPEGWVSPTHEGNHGYLDKALDK